MIKAVIFDLSEVFLRGLYGTHKLVADKLGTPQDDESFFVPEMSELFHAKITEEQYWQAVIKQQKWDIKVDELKNLVRSNFGEIAGTRSIIEKLKQKGYKMGLLSIHAKEWIDYCEQKFDYHKLFDTTVYSFDIGISKPDNRAYLHILEKLNVKPQEAVFIDDSTVNVAAAGKLGMKAIVFKTPAKLEKDLKLIGAL